MKRLGLARNRFQSWRGMFRSGDVVSNSESAVVDEPLINIDAMARQIIEARFNYVTSVMGLLVMEDILLGPNEIVIRVGSRLFNDIKDALRKNLK